jgi:hypothetical protein
MDTELAAMPRIPVRVWIGNLCNPFTGLLDELVPKTIAPGIYCILAVDFKVRLDLHRLWVVTKGTQAATLVV